MQTKWKLTLVISSVAGFCGFLYLLFSAYTLFRGETYHESLAAVQSHPEVIEALGTPMEPSVLFSPNFFFSSIFVRYEIRGPKANGKVFMFASKEEDHWTLDTVWVLPDGSEEPIGVMEPAPISSSGNCNAPIDDYETPDYPTEEADLTAEYEKI